MSKFIEYVGFPKHHFRFSWYVWALVLFWLVLPLTIWTLSHVVYIFRCYSRRKHQQLTPEINEVTIIVLGDLGHSPRMSYHAQSFKNLGYHVNICGYLESSLPKFLYDDDITIHEIPVVRNDRKLPYLLFAAIKVVLQMWRLTWMLIDILGDETRYVVVQNPPSLPILAILGLLKTTWVPNIQLVVDWHNLNWSILNLKYQNVNHPVVKFMKWYEKSFSKRFADLNLTVTVNLKKYLIEEFDLDPASIVTLYDRPSEIFSPLKDQAELKRIIAENPSIFSNLNYDQNKDRILVTSTSFTPDEDFGILVDALKQLDDMLHDDNRLIMLVTGKGPLETTFTNAVKGFEWKHISIHKIWLPIEQYPNILKISDIGLSLHYSSSGLDLPMKIVDLFGSGVPVITLSYPVIKELVQDNVNGVILHENVSNELAQAIYTCLYRNKKKYLTIKEGALKESTRRWDHEWCAKLKPLLALSRKSWKGK